MKVRSELSPTKAKQLIIQVFYSGKFGISSLYHKRSFQYSECPFLDFVHIITTGKITQKPKQDTESNQWVIEIRGKNTEEVELSLILVLNTLESSLLIEKIL